MCVSRTLNTWLKSALSPTCFTCPREAEDDTRAVLKHYSNALFLGYAAVDGVRVLEVIDA